MSDLNIVIPAAFFYFGCGAVFGACAITLLFHAVARYLAAHTGTGEGGEGRRRA